MSIAFVIFFGVEILYIIMSIAIISIITLVLSTKFKRRQAEKIIRRMTAKHTNIALSVVFIAVTLACMITTKAFLLMLNERDADTYITVFTTLSSLVFLVKILNDNKKIDKFTLWIKDLCKKYLNKK